jgi:hypothetical protein
MCFELPLNNYTQNENDKGMHTCAELPGNLNMTILSRGKWRWMRFGLVIGFIELLKQHVTTNNYDSITEFHTPKITHKVSQFSLAVAWCFQRRTSSLLWVPELSPASATSFSLLTTTFSWFYNNSRDSLRVAVYRQSVRLGAKSLEDHDKRFLQVNPCGSSPSVTSSLTRG